jgi:cell division protein FtsB
MNDYQRLILGLEYSLETERKKNQELTLKNLSLESEISNLRNLLAGPD